jgi:magnesium transporter
MQETQIKDSKVFMEVFYYRPGSDHVEEGATPEELRELLKDPSIVIWADFRGDTDEFRAATEETLLNVFKFHYLTVEDCLELRHQPKIEPFTNYLFFIMHGVKPEVTNAWNFATKELDGYLGSNFVVTYHHEDFRSVNHVKQQVRISPYAFQRGSAYVLHQILDNLVDHYMPVIDDFDVAIDELEDKVLALSNTRTAVLEYIMDVRRSVARLKRISTRQMEVLYRLSHGEFTQIPENVLPFFRDVHDHLLRISDLSESYRDMIAGLIEIHFAVTANRTNDVMKTLAVVSAIILPLSLIAGIYGMNFEYMPELQKPYGYFATLGLMIVLTAGLLFYFKRRGWIFQGDNGTLGRDDRD